LTKKRRQWTDGDLDGLHELVTGFYVAVELFKTTLGAMSGAVGCGGRLHLTLIAAEGIPHPKKRIVGLEGTFSERVDFNFVTESVAALQCAICVDGPRDFLTIPPNEFSGSCTLRSFISARVGERSWMCVFKLSTGVLPVNSQAYTWEDWQQRGAGAAQNLCRN